jgi:hypothetical protein
LQQPARACRPTLREALRRFVAWTWPPTHALGTVRLIGNPAIAGQAKRSHIMFVAIVENTPHWVWALFIGLVVLGYSQTRPRDMTVLRVTLLPLAMLGLSAPGVLSSFGHFPMAIGGWAAGVGAALTLARRLIAVRAASWSPETGTLHVPGSWLPLALMVGLFSLKYFAGVKLAMHPTLATDALFAGLISFAYGSFSGLFMARAMSLRALVPGAARLRSA